MCCLAQQDGGKCDDLAHLCAIFSTDPFISAFAQRFGQFTSQPASGDAADGVPPTTTVASSGGEAAEGGWEEVCRTALYDCISGDKTDMLPAHLSLYSALRVMRATQDWTPTCFCHGLGHTRGCPCDAHASHRPQAHHRCLFPRHWKEVEIWSDAYRAGCKRPGGG